MTDLFPGAPTQFQFTGEQLIHEAQREHGKRVQVYPRLVAKGSLTQAQADRHIAMMSVIIRILQAQPMDKLYTEPAP